MIGGRIKEYRKRKGYSITQLATLAGVSKSYLSYIERDLRTNPSLEFLGKLAKTLDTNIEELLENEDEVIVDNIDEEWRILLNQAIESGLNKEDFRTLQDYIKFKNWKEMKNI